MRGAGAFICSPTPNEVVTSPVNFVASGVGASGTVNHLELWIDSRKIGNFFSDQMNTSVALPAGPHQATVVEVDSNFNYIRRNKSVRRMRLACGVPVRTRKMFQNPRTDLRRSPRRYRSPRPRHPVAMGPIKAKLVVSG